MKNGTVSSKKTKSAEGRIGHSFASFKSESGVLSHGLVPFRDLAWGASHRVWALSQHLQGCSAPKNLYAFGFPLVRQRRLIYTYNMETQRKAGNSKTEGHRRKYRERKYSERCRRKYREAGVVVLVTEGGG